MIILPTLFTIGGNRSSTQNFGALVLSRPSLGIALGHAELQHEAHASSSVWHLSNFAAMEDLHIVCMGILAVAGSHEHPARKHQSH